jgi:hypothetical protein
VPNADLRERPVAQCGRPNKPFRISDDRRRVTARLFRRGHGAGGNLRARAVALVDIVDHHRLEFGRDVGAAQSAEFLAVDEYRRRRDFTGAGQGDADIGVPGFTGAAQYSELSGHPCESLTGFGYRRPTLSAVAVDVHFRIEPSRVV